MNSHFKPLGRKVAMAILGTTFLALLFTFVLNIFPLLHASRQETTNKARALASLLAASLEAAVDFDDHTAASEDLSSLALSPNVIGAGLYTHEQLFASYGEVPLLPSSASLPPNDVQLRESISELLIVHPLPAGKDSGRLVLRISYDSQFTALRSYIYIASGIFLCVFFFCITMAGRYRKKLGDPLRELTDTISQLSKEKAYARRVEHVSDDELGMLVTEFNDMLSAIERRDIELSKHQEYLEQKVDERTMELRRSKLELLNKNRMLLYEIRKRSQAEMIRDEVERINRHDLKSSLSLVIGYPELLLANGDLNPDQQKSVKRIRAAGYRMLDMIRNHLDMFKMEKGIYSLQPKPVDLVETICELEEEFAPLLTSSGVELGVKLNGVEVVGREEFCIPGEEQQLRAMLRNLIQNGIEASERGERVTVELTEEHTHSASQPSSSSARKRIAVHNPAPVPKEVRQRMFDKYVTHGKENGTGLGTYIAALIARTHGATIAMHTNKTDGTTVTVSFRNHPPTKTEQAQPALTTPLD